MNEQEKEKPELCPYGYCPKCLAPGFSRERRPFGDDTCTSGHRYPSATALKGPFTRQQTELVALVRVVKESSVSCALSDEDVAGALKGKAELDQGLFVTLEELRSQVNEANQQALKAGSLLSGTRRAALQAFRRWFTWAMSIDGPGEENEDAFVYRFTQELADEAPAEDTLLREAQALASRVAVKFGPHQDACFAIARLTEEVGELAQAATAMSKDRDIDRGPRIREEAIDVIAMVLRLLREFPEGLDAKLGDK